MATKSATNLNEKPSINLKSVNLASTVNSLLDNFDAGEQKKAELANRFLEQRYFRWEESLINKLIEADPSITFDVIKNWWITLSMLLDNEWIWNFKSCLDKIDDNVKHAIIQKIFDNVKDEIWTNSPYDDFDTTWTCAITQEDTDVLWYFRKIVNYLEDKQWSANAKKVEDILEKVRVTNGDINWALGWLSIPEGTQLSAVPENIRDGFNALLSFEIWKCADYVMHMAEDFSQNFQWLLMNTLPAINTVVWESDEYRFDETKLWDEYQSKSQAITNDSNLGAKEKDKQINELKWEYYLKYLKTKNAKLGNALEQLYNNNFDYSKLEPTVLKDYFDKAADIRLKMLADKWINEFIKSNWGNVDEFKSFYKELTNVDPNNSTLNITLSENTPDNPTTWLINIPVQRRLVKWQNLWLKDINQFWKNAEKSFDALPMEFTINKSDIEWLPIDAEDKATISRLLSEFDKWDTYEIKWEKVWILIFLFFAINNRSLKTHTSAENEENAEKIMEKEEKTNNKNEEIKDNEWEAFTPGKFKEEIEKLGPGKFENGSEIWLPVWQSELPGWWYQRMKVKLSKINMKDGTFTWTTFGGELEFSKIEWKSMEFKMDQKTLNRFNKLSNEGSNGEDKVWLLPNPDKADFNSFKDRLNNKLWTANLSFPVDWVTWDEKNNKFMRKAIWKEKPVEVKYFWARSDDKSTYKIEYNPIKRCFTVTSTFNWDKKWKDWKMGKERLSYKRNMDWNNFLIFFTQKWLTPQTEEESNSAVMRQNADYKIVNGNHWALHWFTINNVKNWFKSIFWALKKSIDDYNKRKDEEFRRSVEGPVLNALAALPFLPPSIRNAIWETQQDLYNEEYNGARPEIERYLKALQSDEQFADTFDQVPPHVQTLYWTSYQKFIIDLFNRKWDTSTTEKRKAAALLLANIQKWQSPYRGLTGYEDTWLWVKTILWDAHHKLFMEDKRKCELDCDSATEQKQKERLQGILARCEIDYIINNVSWANWKLDYFGSHEKRWLPGNEDATNFIPNPSKIILSDKFSGELKNAYKWWFTASNIEESCSNIAHNDFNQAKADFVRFITSSRTPNAIANLKKMFKEAKTEGQLLESQKYFLIYMLSWILDINGTKDVREQAYKWWTTMQFLPGMLAKKWKHSEQVVELLDDFCKEKWYEKFSNTVNSYFRKWYWAPWKINIKNLINDVTKRAKNDDIMKEFDQYCKITFRSKDFSGNPQLQKLQEDVLNPDTEDIDDSLLDNKLIANKWWLFSNQNVVHSRIALDTTWEFSWKQDDIDNKKSFWNQVKSDISHMDPNNVNHLRIVLTQFFNRFDVSSADKQTIFSRINTAYYRKTQGLWKHYIHPPKDNNGMDMWAITSREIDSVLRYAFKWRVLFEHFNSKKIPIELNNTLEAFQNFFEQAFNAETFRKSSDVISKIFNVGDRSDFEVLPLWSWDSYVSTIDDKNSLWNKNTNEQDALWKNFLSWNFINYKIAQMEKTFRDRSLPEKLYKPIRNKVQDNIKFRLFDQSSTQNTDTFDSSSTQHQDTFNSSSTQHQNTFNSSPTQENVVLKSPSSKKRNQSKPRSTQYVRI